MSGGEGQPFGPYALGYVAHNLALQRNSGPKALLACGSFRPEASNFVELLALDFEASQPVKAFGPRLPHYFPPTEVRWLGGSSQPSSPDILASSGDHIRIWSTQGELRRLLRHEKNPQGLCTPITSLDTDTSASSTGVNMASCDIYGVCAFWDVEHGVMAQALDLGQPLCSVAFGPGGLVAAVGDRGDCFLIDPRQPQDVSVFAPREQVSGPARMSWGSKRPDLLAVSWQGGRGGVVLYGGSAEKQQVVPHRLRSSMDVCADVQWSPAFPELLCCAGEVGAVEVWQFPEAGLMAAAAEMGPCFRWEPASAGQACTAMALSHEVRPGQHALILATSPSADTPHIDANSGSLWLAALPPPLRPTGMGRLGVAPAVDAVDVGAVASAVVDPAQPSSMPAAAPVSPSLVEQPGVQTAAIAAGTATGRGCSIGERPVVGLFGSPTIGPVRGPLGCADGLSVTA